MLINVIRRKKNELENEGLKKSLYKIVINGDTNSEESMKDYSDFSSLREETPIVVQLK